MNGEWEYGVRYEAVDGFTYETAGFTEKAALAFVADHSKQSWRPRPIAVVRRACGEWETVEEAG